MLGGRGPYQDAMMKFAPILVFLILGFGVAVLVVDYLQARPPSPSTAVFPANKNTLVRMLVSKK